MKLYLRTHHNEVTPSWWDNFEATLVPRYVGTDALKKHIEDRRVKLDACGALLQWDKDTGLPYLYFNNADDKLMFVLRWS